MIREHVRVMTEALGASPLAFEVSSLEPREQAAIVAARDRYEHALRDILALGMREGVFRRDDPKLAALIVLGALNGIARWYRPEGAWDAHALGDAFVRQLASGVHADRLVATASRRVPA